MELFKENPSFPCPPQFSSCQEYFTDLTSLLNEHQNLWLGINIAELVEEGSFDCIPQNWKLFVESLGDDLTETLFEIACGRVPSLSTIPTSLKTLIERSVQLRLSRKPVTVDTPAQFSPLGFKPKKKHEVEAMAGILASAAQATAISDMVDLGAGHGYVTHAIAAAAGINAVGLDYDPKQTEGAVAKWELYRTANDVPEGISVRHSTVNLERSQIERVIPQIEALFSPLSSEEHNKSSRKWMIVGLHICGDLSTTALDLFLKSKASMLLFAGCCYHKVTPDVGLSDYARSLHFTTDKASRSYAAMLPLMDEMHTIFCPMEAGLWVKRQRHLYHRAVVEAILKKRNQRTDVVGKALRKVPPQLSLQLYLEKALDMSGNVPLSGLELAWVEREATQLSSFLFLSSLRSLLSPLIEASIVADRFLYLSENCQNGQVGAFPIFNPIISPRNILIWAKK